MLMVIRYSFLAVFLLVGMIIACYAWVSGRSNSYIFSNIQALPSKQVALVLGTNKYLRGGGKNEYYHHRIQAAVQLYQAGKVNYFVVSGDNRKNNYNEPKQMTDDLIAAGVPAERIQPDYAGFRTLDSVLRMEKVFGHRDYVIISQRFHNQRAIFLARAHGQNPIAFDADNPKLQNMTRVITREFLARVKAALDLVTNKQAKFYGDKIQFPPLDGLSKRKMNKLSLAKIKPI